jgi:hypothetical protein
MPLSDKQKRALYLIEEDPIVTDVFYGGGAGCFNEDTLVLTSQGPKAIARIKPGEHVLSYNESGHYTEFKKVLDKYAFGCNRQKHKLIIFAFNETKIKCTYEHEFYIKGNWVPAYRLASRAMEVGEWLGESLCGEQLRPFDDNGLQGVKDALNNETRLGQQRLFKDYVKVERQNGDYQGSQDSGSKLVGEYRQQAYCESPQRREGRQQSCELGMGNHARERKTRLRQWLDKETYLHQLCQRVKDWYVKVKRGASKGDKGEVQATGLHASNVSGRVWGCSVNHQGRNFKALEAREIDLNAITSIEFTESDEVVYDLHVEGNHNYVLARNNTLVHNSGKTFLGCFWQITRRWLYPGTRGFMGRNTLSDFKATTLKTFNEVWEQKFKNNPYGLTMKVNMNEKIVHFSNGSEILIKDLSFNSNDPEFNDLGGMELTDAFIDEVPGITQKAKNVVYSRIRWNLINDKPILLSTGNPTDNWVKKEYVSDKHNNPVELPQNKAYVQALLTDNPDAKFVEIYSATLRNLPEYDRMRLLDGRWDASETIDNPYMHGFNPDIHVNPCAEYNEALPVMLSMDFNVNPLCFIASHVYREGHKTKVHIFEEFEIKSASIPKLIETIEARFDTRSLLRITGDAMGNRGDIRFRDNISIYDEILRTLRLSRTQLMLKGNPQHNNSRSACNHVLLNPEYEFRIHPRCISTIRDMRIVACDSTGSIIKSNRKNIAEQADFLDCVRYLIHNFVK